MCKDRVSPFPIVSEPLKGNGAGGGGLGRLVKTAVVNNTAMPSAHSAFIVALMLLFLLNFVIHT